MSPIFALAVAVALGCLQQCEAELPAVGNCSFMEYYCTLREYESQFFKKLYKDPGADCGLQFWILYYRSIKKAETCLSNSKKLEVANIKETQLLYCSGFDLEIPLMSSLSPCSDAHKRKVDQCINEFATTFSNFNSTSKSSLCRERGEAKLCAVLAWKTACNYSEIADGIYNKVIGDLNPFCSNDKDPWASGTDLCANYRIPYHDPECDCRKRKPTPKPTDQNLLRKNAAGIRHGVAPLSLNLLLCMAVILYLDNLTV
ncbi:hypothetical protein OS493_031714 [Desmophyllum pertusum]|uniref:Secreted protein n=1 Tax=Desmophyllum pertusum TaxID=174260 RepID=A0A9W9ZJK6_9CNID|nr:hypothetical protein OS493_031714 [Desmophyllum pertusum]